MSEQRPEYKIEGRPPTIFRTIKNRDNPYVMIDRRLIDNPNLSFKAKGILTYLLSRPDGWEVNLVDLANRSTEGLSAIKSGVKELKKAGHLKHAGTRNVDGQFGTVIWEVYESPQVDNQLTDTPQVGGSPQVGFMSPQVEKPQADKPQADNRTQVLSTLSSNNLKDININGTHTFQKTSDDRFGAYLDTLAEGQAKHKPYVDIVERLSAGLHLNFPPYGTSKDVDHVAHMIALAEADHPDQTVEKFCEWATATKDAKELSWYRIKVDGIWGDWLLPYMPERNGKGNGGSHKPDYTQDPDLYYLKANKNGRQRADSIARLEAQGMIEQAKTYLKPQELENLYVHTPA